jgi:hypothetical protein
MEEAFLTKCVVDPIKRSFYLYSSEGEKRVVNCDNTDEFMNVLELVRTITPDDALSYTDPLM